MDYRRHDDSVRCRVASELIAHEPPRLTALTLEKLAKESLCRTAIAPLLDENIDEIAILIDGTPQILPMAANRDEDLVEMPDIAEPPLVPLELRGVAWAELPTPLANRFVGDHNSALGQQILDITEA